MKCASCGHANPESARFCNGCGAALDRGCASCGAENPPGSRFCNACGASLASAPERGRGSGTADAVGTRKVVTIVFADLIGSTALHERLDPESVRRVMQRYYRAVRVPVEAHGGTVVQLLGDGVMCAFGVPRVAEDDAIRAVRAAVAVQKAFREFAHAEQTLLGAVGLRVAVNTGEVVVSDEYAAGIGDPLNVAARLQQEAQDGQVLLGESTQRLVGDLVTLAHVGTFALKGRAEGVTAYRVVSLERPAGAAATPFVGRDDEVRRLTAIYDAAVAAPGARLAVILGSPGLGKSRLLAELGRRVGDRAAVLSAHCDAAAGATFAPLAAALRTHLHLEDGAGRDTVRAAVTEVVPGEESARVADGIAALLAGTPASPEETFFVVRRLLAAIASTRPLVLAIDDLQWAEPLLLDLTEHLVQWSSGVPLLVLVAARPELRDLRSSLVATGPLVADVVTLGGLDAAAATRLAANVVGTDALPAAIAGRVLATSEGNPLFVGELVRMLVQDGALKREGDRWIAGAELAAVEMPPTIQALLAARIERLRPEERTVLERAAVVGRQFSRAAVAQLLPRELTDLDARLESLRRSELIESDVGWLLGEPVLRFHHVLIRDAAYRRVLKGTRAELHARFADWLEAKAGDTVEQDETLGWHLERAHQNLRDLGPLDEQGRTLGERAARHLAAAGRRALARDDVPVAASLVGRALARLDEADPARADLALDWCEALLASGDVGTAAKAIAELGRFVDGSDRLRSWHTCLAAQHAVLTDPQSLRVTVDAVAAAAATLAGTGDAPGEAKAHHVHAMALARLGKVGECEAALDRALTAARRGHDRRRANAVLSGVPLAALWGPSPVTRASGRCLDVVRVLRITQGAPAVEAVALRCQAVLEALRGRTDAARRMLASSRRLVEELGITQRLLEADVAAGQIDLYEGDAAAAERSLRAAYEGLRAHGLGIDAAQAAALLGRALLALGRDADAEALSHESEALAGDDLRAAVAWRGVRAEALARRGEHAAAVELARAAVGIASATDALLDHADARRALGVALRAAGRAAEADAEDARTIDLWEAKGATLLVERTRRADEAAERQETVSVTRRVDDRPVRRRVRPNAVATNVARFDAAIAARDADALAALLSDDHEIVDHPNGRTYGRTEVLDYLGSLLRAKGLSFCHELVATLGTSLALCRGSLSVDELVEDDGTSFGKSTYEFYIVVEGNADQHWRVEQFADDHLGDAVARLYARYAELLPDGPARERAAATARSVAAVLLLPRQQDSIDAFATAVDPDIEFVDHQPVGFGSARGADGVLRGLRTLVDLTEGSTNRTGDVLGLRPESLLTRQTNFGADRAGGGPYERHFLALRGFGANGLLTRLEWFPLDREDEALARFDALAAGSPANASRAPVHPRVRPNAATASAARLDAAVGARDVEAFPALFADDLETVHHPTGTAYGRDAVISSLRSALRLGRGLAYRHEPLGTLGGSLALCRHTISAIGYAGGDLDIGPSEREELHLIEADAHGQRRRAEAFASDRLAVAVARLYERYADLLPAGPVRDRAAATARSVGTMLLQWRQRDFLDSYVAAVDPAMEFVDHQPVGHGSVRGAGEFLRGLRALLDLTDDATIRVDEVLCLQPDALLLRLTNFGTARAGGGAYEIHHLSLWRFGAVGLLTRIEWFPPDREDEALARFDALAAGSPADDVRTPVGARVRANVATAQQARLDAAIAARDADALPALFAENGQVVHHPTGVDYDVAGILASYRPLLSVRDQTHRFEPVATLGDALALSRLSVSTSGDLDATGSLDFSSFGAIEMAYVTLIDVDAHGLMQRAEFFADDRLGNGVVRLYERYAELLPAGPARDRAAATARSVAAFFGSFDLDRWATAIAADVEFVDHRSLVGFGSMRGAQALLRSAATYFDVADDIVGRCAQVIAAEPDALLVSWTTSGKARVGGGPFEREVVRLWRFGPDGLVTHNEMFDVGREAEALARFDALAAASAHAPATMRRVRPNAATALALRIEAAIAAHDIDALGAGVTDDLEMIDHATGAAIDRNGLLFSFRSAFKARDLTCTIEPLATLGDSLALWRASMSGGGFAGGQFDVGPYEREELSLNEVDAQGRRRRIETFAPAHLADAVARMYERHAEILPEGPARERAAATARSVAVVVKVLETESVRAVVAPAIEYVDHRRLGFETVRGAEPYLRGLRSLWEVAENVVARIDDVLGLGPEALLLRRTTLGNDRAGGGAFEQEALQLRRFGDDGRVTRHERFDVDQSDQALARFDELTAGSPAHGATADRAPARHVRPNAVTTHLARFDAAFAARDHDAIADLLADTSEVVHHPTGTTYAREALMSQWRKALRTEGPAVTHEVLASLGESLALCRRVMSASAVPQLDSGAVLIDNFVLIEVDAGGRRLRTEVFAESHLGDAVMRLYERHAELLPEGPERTRAAATAHSIMAIITFDANRPPFARDMECVDHRALGLWSARGAAAAIRRSRALLELADDVTVRVHDVLGARSDAILWRSTFSGTDRASGGAFELHMLQLRVFGADGLQARLEFFDPDATGEALARFDELTEPAAARLATAPVRSAKRHERRVRPNAATADAARLDSAMAARDLDTLTALSARESQTIDHPTGTTYDNMGDLASRRMMLRARDLQFHHEPLATLGESLALFRLSISASGVGGGKFDVGAYERELLVLSCGETDTRKRQAELFATDRLGDAIVRLYERYAEFLPEGPERTRAAATARSVAVMGRPVATAYAPAIEVVDHRVLGTWSARGAEAALQHHRSLREVADEIVVREDDILGLRADALLVRRTHRGTDQAGGGAYERLFLMLWVFGPDGLVARIEYFDDDREAEALARFDELAAEPPPAARITNAATRSWDRFREAWEARDWERFAAIFAQGFRQFDRRRMVRLDLDRDEYLQTMRMIFEMSSSRFTTNLLATRGERLLLSRFRFEGTDRSFGPSEVEGLVVVEVDGAGDRVASVHLDPDDLDEAYAELDRRYAAGEAAPYARTWETFQRLQRAVIARDWGEEWASVFDPDLVLEDHRPIGFETKHSRDALLPSLRALVDLAPDVTWRLDHVLALDDRGMLFFWRWAGSREGGPFEIPVVGVWVLGPDGRVQRIDNYNPEQLDAARVRFDAIRVDAARDPLAALVRPNAASAAGDRWVAALAARDWAAIRALCASDAKFEDRRRLVRTSGDVDWWITEAQRTASMPNTRLERQRVGTAGDRVTLERILLTGDPGGATAAAAIESRWISSLGPFEIEFLWVGEVDGTGRITAGIRFDVDDRRAATREAFSRWFARDAIAAASVGPAFELAEAINEHDRTRLRETLADDFALIDHRPARLSLIEGADAWVESYVALWDLAPDAQIESAGVLAHARYGSVSVARVYGTLRDGGTFEIPTVSVAIVAAGRLTRIEMFEPEHVDAALARFAELRPDPLRIPPNAATRANDRALEAGEAQDWDALRALCAATLEFDDRRRGLRTSGDLETCLTSWKYIFSRRARPASTLLATSGDRLALHRTLWTGAEDRTPFEIEILTLTEVDAEGRIVARLMLDPEDRRAAAREMRERAARSDVAQRMPAALLEFARALFDRDLVRCRAALPDDFVFHDHRLTGIGRVEHADDYVPWFATLLEQSPDALYETLYTVARAPHGSLSVMRLSGTLAEGGPFESVYVNLVQFEGDRFVATEIFELEHLDVARARFEALRPDPLRIPPNAASRVRDRTRELSFARDWPALRALASEDFAFDERRKRALVTGGVDLWIASAKEVVSPGVGYERELIATFGERIALDRLAWTGDDGLGDGVRWEVDVLRLTEIDADGRLRASISFDADDRHAALREGYARFLAGEAAATGGQLSPLLTWARARDRVAARSCLADDFALHDHRQLGLGTLGRDEWIESLWVMDELAPGWRWETFRIFAWNRHGSVDACRQFGTIRDGGPFENVLIRVMMIDGDRIRRNEVFAIDDVDRALARFEELCAECARERASA